MIFDVDCGESLFPGHRIIARGLSDEGRSSDDLSSGDQSGHEECQMVDLVYEIVPGVDEDECPTDPSEPFTVDATYDADVPLGWSTGNSGPDASGGPGWIEMYRGGASTVGGLGPWPIPSGARQLTFWLQQVRSFSCQGELHVDLTDGGARWGPTAS